ncbi:MAG TPA: hypothetical protein VIV60_37690, partial [Polyangiaceae bacterium]
MGPFTALLATESTRRLFRLLAALGIISLVFGCSREDATERGQAGIAVERSCALAARPAAGASAANIEAYEAALPASLQTLECKSDFDALASEPLEAGVPGVRAIKFVINRFDQSESPLGKLYFQNTDRYNIHYDFVVANIRSTVTFTRSEFDLNYTGSYDERQFYL